MEPGFSRVVYMQMMTKWMRLWGIGVIIMMGRLGWAIAMRGGWRWQVPLSLAFASALGIPLYRIWRLFKKLLVVWAEDDARQQKAREERAALDREEKRIELLERERKVRMEAIRQDRERKRQVRELDAIRDELEDELHG
jgi:hypothetical protein